MAGCRPRQRPAARGLPVTLDPERTVDAGRELPRRSVRLPDGSDLAYVASGEGPPVVLLHGTLTVLEDMMLALAASLTPRRRVIAFDRPGFGRSSWRRFVDAGLWRQAERLHEALSVLGIDRPIVVGHSFGASVALAMAMRRPERVRGVVALAPLAAPELRLEHLLFAGRSTPNLGPWMSGVAAASSDRSLYPLLWRAMYLPQAMPEAVQASFPFDLAARAGSAIRIGEDSAAVLADLVVLNAAAAVCPVPVRILAGDRDLVVRNDLHGPRLAAMLPGGAFTPLPGLGHMVHHFAAAEIVHAVDEIAGA